MKIIFISLFFALLLNITFANDAQNSELEVINLHETKSLDQMVLDNLNAVEEIDEITEVSNEVVQNENDEQGVQEFEFSNDNFIFKNQIKDLNMYFDNLQNINSKLYKNN